jgi:hypothetical protein
MNDYGGADVLIEVFLISALDGGEFSDSQPCQFNTKEEGFGTNWIGSVAGAKVGLHALPLPGLEVKPFGRPVRIQSLHRLVMTDEEWKASLSASFLRSHP